jgi:16S rRNA (guanine527-N7)-methyltransferase
MTVEKNKVMNLTAITEEDEFLLKHFIDSLGIVRTGAFREMLFPMYSRGSGRVGSEKSEPSFREAGACGPGVPAEEGHACGNLRLADVGTGAGFPGLVLKIVFPEIRVTLFDSLRKRLVFLDEVIAELGLEGAETVHGRAEDLGRDRRFRGAFDIAVSRAVADMAVLSEYCLPFVKRGGIFAAYKSGGSEEEIRKAGNAVDRLGGSEEEITEFCLPESNIRRKIIVIRKTGTTPSAYPRKAGMPSKDPL